MAAHMIQKLCHVSADGSSSHRRAPRRDDQTSCTVCIMSTLGSCEAIWSENYVVNIGFVAVVVFVVDLNWGVVFELGCG